MADEDAPYVEQRAQILDSIERNEEELRQAVEELTEVAREQLTPSEWIKSSPLPFLTGGFLFGMWLGSRRR